MPLADALRDIDRLFRSAACAAARPTRSLAAITALATAASVHAQPRVYFVDDDAPPGGDGRSWHSAFRDLQTALGTVRTYGTGRAVFRIAEGVYSPSSDSAGRNATFFVHSGTTLEGGFGGVLRAHPDDRDIAAFVTVLTGDLARNDGPAFTNRDDNCRHVVTVSAGSFTMDGLTIRGGNDNEFVGIPGGGAIAWGFRSSGFDERATLVDCTLTDNVASVLGGAMLFYDDRTVSMIRCRVVGNRAGASGGAVSGNVTAVGCEFSDNRALNSGGGGAVDGRFGGSNCLFIGNSAEQGGALRGSCLLSACTFFENFASVGGAAAFVEYGSRADNCLFAGNQADVGGAIHVVGDYSNILRSTFANNWAGTGGAVALAEGVAYFNARDSILWGNGAAVGPQIAFGDHSSGDIGRSDLQGGLDGISRGVAANVSIQPGPLLDADPMFADASGPDGDPATYIDNDYRLLPVSPCIDAGECIGSGFWSATDTDLAGRPRFGGSCGLVHCADLGAYEFQPAPCYDWAAAIFVRADAPPGGDGRSWQSAFADLQTALDSPRDRPIWMSGGVYRPSATITARPPRGAGGVQRRIIGGFVGTESHPFQRVPGANPTIISGDRLGNDDGTERGWADNLTALFDGGAVQISMEDITFRASHGHPDYAGAIQMSLLDSLVRVRVEDCFALDNDLVLLGGGSPMLEEVTVANCTVQNGKALQVSANEAELLGCSFVDNHAGVSVADVSCGSALLRGCRFERNSAAGPTLDLLDGFTRIVDGTFIDNVRDGPLTLGGVVRTGFGGASIDRSRFIRNSVTGVDFEALGGAVWASGPLNLSNSLFVGNTVGVSFSSGGSAVYSSGVETVITACTFVGNSSNSVFPHGAVWLDGAAGSVTSSIFWANRRSDGVTGQTAQIEVRPHFNGLPMIVRRCDIDGYEALPGATGIINSDPRFIDPLGADHLPATGDEDFRLLSSSPVVDRADERALPIGDMTTDNGDADEDGNVYEPSPLDLAGAPRAVRAFGTAPASHLVIDLGAFEVQQVLCAPDWNGNGTVTLQDLFDFLSAYFRDDADFNRSGHTDVGDVFDFLAAYFAGCS